MTAMFQQGGWVVGAIVGVSLIAWTVMIWKWLDLRGQTPRSTDWADRAVEQVRRRDRTTARSLCDAQIGCLARMMQAAIRMNETNRDYFEKYLQPLADSERLSLMRGLGFVQALGAAAPLMGLLGTVLGMVKTFQALGEHGMPHMQAMAAGVSQALVTTQVGLVVGLVIVLLCGHLTAKAQRCIDMGVLYAKKIETAVLHD